MKFSAILNAVQAALQTWAATYGGGAEVAGDAAAAFQVLANKPSGVRAVVWLSSEEKRGEHEEASMVDDRIQVIISRGRSMKLRLGDTHVNSIAGEAALVDLVEEARDIVRGISLTEEETEVTLDYQGFDFIRDSEGPQDGYQLSFSIGNLMGPPSATPSQGSLIGLGLKSGLGQVLDLTDDTQAVIPSGTEVFDELEGYSSNVFTAPATGIYLVEVAYSADQSGGPFEWNLVISANGFNEAFAPGTDQYKRLITQVKLQAGQTVEPSVFHETGVPRSFGGPSLNATPVSYLKIARLT